MKLKKNKMPGKSKPPISSIVMYTFATIVALIAVAFLINNILLFKNIVARYVAQGYPSAEVVKELLPNQLLPGIFEPIAVYGGIAFILFGTGIINQKVSKYLMLAKAEVDAPDIETTDIEPTEQVEAVEEISQVTNETQQSPEN